ncbi:MAG: pyridoxal 5'-phosphate synthase glutaminase subunit PdxT [Candidatus Riflebacteria bacterium HGW-Riflebacteria-2]|jgi:5'-phosphate synthase pdxT subunit|nr:MAG: pyridoxal 5'-phosphate synthase glutaminase subunit PdxT [Candidatus Riflebacteria bacterium HGW-Riflebacteria-2]
MTTIGILALQGAVREHAVAVEKCGARAVAVKSVEDLQNIDGLILPGGESTTMRRLIDTYDMMKQLKRFISLDKPVFGTCAGLILLARTIEGSDESHIGMMDIVVRRNSYGRQVNSFETALEIKDVGNDFPGVFIRAPHIISVDEGVEILCEHDGRIVMARQDCLLACAFHPELTDDTRVMAYFVKMVRASIIARIKH